MIAYKKAVASVTAVFALALAGTMLVPSQRLRAADDKRADDDKDKHDKGKKDESRVRQGFEIAPVPLHFEKKNRELVGLGSYIVNAVGDCNGCHSAGPASEFVVNPYFRGNNGAKQVNATTYLAGGRDFGPVGNLPHVYSRNLTPDVNGLPIDGRSFTDFVSIMRHGTDFDHIHPNCPTSGPLPFNCVNPPFDGDLLLVMRWPNFQGMTDHDLLAIYTYLSAVPCKPGPSGLDPRLYEQNVCQ